MRPRNRSSLGLRFLLSFVGLCCCAYPQSRHALVIGNNAYPGNRLKNARNDAEAVSKTLRSMGYKTTSALDADYQTFTRSLDSFVAGIKPGDVALVYFSGHGFQIDGENYLVPTDFSAGTTRDAKAEAIPMSRIIDSIQLHEASTQIIILDACRNNPFLGSRSFGGGWATPLAPRGTFIAFGTSPGATASDGGSDKHGAFTEALLKYLGTDKEDIESVFRRVREDTIRDSGGEQVPWIASDLIGTFHLNPTLDQFGLRSRYMETVKPQERNGGIVGRALQTGEYVEGGAAMQRAVSLARGERFDEALQVLKDIISSNPYGSVALRIAALVYHALGRDREAMDILDRDLTVNPKDGAAASYRCALRGIAKGLSTTDACRIEGVRATVDSTGGGNSSALVLGSQQ